MATLTFLEEVDSKAPSVQGCARDGGKSTRTWQLLNPGASDVQNAITQILGSTVYKASQDGRLHRTPPLADPHFPFWYASNIPTFYGLGQSRQVPADQDLEVPPFPDFALYPEYHFVVESTPRPYPILTDGKVRKYTGTWYDESGNPNLYGIVTEWNRWCDFDFLPQNDFITSERGRMAFSTGSGSTPNNHSYQAMPRVQLPNSLYKIIFYEVPLRYLSSSRSYIRRWKGYVNQAKWVGPGGFSFYPGSLLYLGWNIARKYTLPVQNLVQLADTSYVVSTEKFCDVELNFLYTERKGTDLPAAPANKNFVVAGHNLQNWFTSRNFYYAQTVPKTGTGVPSWYSFPVELLFYDPDAPNFSFPGP